MSEESKGELSNFDINDMCNVLDIKLNGIYMKNELNKIKCKSGCYIINMSNTGEAGTHWIALYINKNNAIYSDSFGISPPDQIVLFLKNITNISYNRKQIQDVKSSACGFFCILFLYICLNLDSDDKPDKIIKYMQSLFDPNKLNKNAKILYKLIDKLLGSKNI
jgi:hypothetical protein